jgi:antibiotic biosynthesis monooxygenase (ABM) superfamily enzyme
MYLVRTGLMVRAGEAAEFEARQQTMAETTRGLPGYLGMTLLQSYSDPAKYAVTLSFDSVEAAWAYGKSNAFEHSIRDQLVGAVTIAQQEGYDTVLEVNANPMPAAATCEILVDEWLKGPEVTPAFEGTLRQLFELRKEHAVGFGTNFLGRSGGKLGQYLVIQRYSDLEAAKRANTAPEVQAFIQTHPASLYTDQVVHPEAYAIVFCL